MSDKYIFIETNQFRREAIRWLKALKRQENATVLFVPKTDRLIRLMHLLNNRRLIKDILGDPDEYIFLRINFDPHDTEELDDLSFQIAENLNLAKIVPQTYTFLHWLDYFTKHSLKLILMIPEAEKYLSASAKQVLDLISELNERYSPMIRILSFFETDIRHPSYIQFMPASTRLYENICHYSLYSRDDTLGFINMMEKLWEIQVDESDKEKIIDASGGHFWLVKEALREISASGSWSVKSGDMRFRLRTIYELLLPSERSAVRKVISHYDDFNHEEQLSLKYLQKMGIISPEKKSLIGAYTDFLLTQKLSTRALAIKNGHVYLNDVLIDRTFSRQELRVLKLFLDKTNTIVSREEISNKMWPIDTQKQFSEWAIDQLIRRLRKRLAELGLSPSLLKVVRGAGYRFELSLQV